MGVPLKQQIRLGMYIVGKKLRGEKRYPLVLMLEPLFRCNLACAGCGKIDYPDHILDKRITVQEAMDAIDECGAPVVSIAGGEPLIHKEMPEIVEGFVKKKKYVYLCTNALLLKKRIKDYTPSEYLTFSIHLDGNQAFHRRSPIRAGTDGIVIARAQHKYTWPGEVVAKIAGESLLQHSSGYMLSD